MTNEEFAQGIEIHSQLNPLLWDENEQLREEVRGALARIADRFAEFLETPITVLDIIVTGSQANYAYTPHSDLDLHVIVPFEGVECEEPVRDLFDAKRKLWKEEHKIFIHGVPVECYVEDSARPVKGSSYSILQNRWVRKPAKQSVVIPHDLDQTASAWTRLIIHAIDNRSLDQLNKIRDLLADYRRVGLDRQGEFGRANQVFKMLRNSGVIADLHRARTLLQDRRLSVK